MKIKLPFVLSTSLGTIASFVVYGSVATLCNSLGGCRPTAWSLPLIPLFLGIVLGIFFQKIQSKKPKKALKSN